MASQNENPSNQWGKRSAGASGPGQPEPRLLEQVRNLLRLHHYSIHFLCSFVVPLPAGLFNSPFSCHSSAFRAESLCRFVALPVFNLPATNFPAKFSVAASPSASLRVLCV